LGYGNLSGSGANGSWQDLDTFGFGFCYCVSVETTEPSSTCCDSPALCAGDTDGNGIVDPLDAGGVLARFGFDVTIPGVCQYDLDCNGIIDPLDQGYVLARFGTCGEVLACAPGGGECGPGGGDPPPPPANDDCANAMVVLAGSHAFDNTLATTDGPLDCDPFTGNNDLWYNYTATADGTLLVSLCQDTDFDSTLSVYNGTGCPVGAPLDCSDDDCQDPGGPSEISISVTNGQQIKARVAGWTDGNCDANPTGTGTLTISLTPAGQGACCFADETCDVLTSGGCSDGGGTYNGDGSVCSVNLCAIGASNDVCADVVPVLLNVGETITFTGDNSDAAVDDCDTFPELEVWEAFTTTETMDVRLDYCGTGGTFSPVWPYVDASCPCGAFILGDGDFLTCENAETQFIMTLPNLAPGTYYHPVYASPDGTLGPYTINVTGTLPPADCCKEHPQPGCDEIDGVPVEGVDDCVCAVDPFCCESAWDVTCVEEVESLGCADCPIDLPPPLNDECDGAIALACDTSDTVNGIDYTTNSADPVSTCEIASGGPFTKDTSWWYTITVPAGTTSFTVELCDSSGDADSDTVVTLFTRTSSCGALTQQKCGEDECTFPAFGPSIVTQNSPVAGDDYIFLVDVYAPSDADAVYVTTLTCVP
jgi:hypothetical protein